MVDKFACVYLNIKPNQLSKGALYRKLVQYGIDLSTKHPFETNNIFFLNSHLKSITSLVNNKTLHNIPIKNNIFCNQNNITHKILPILGLACF